MDFPTYGSKPVTMKLEMRSTSIATAYETSKNKGMICCENQRSMLRKKHKHIHFIMALYNLVMVDRNFPNRSLTGDNS